MSSTELGYVVVEYKPNCPEGWVDSTICLSLEEAEQYVSDSSGINEDMGFPGITYKIFKLGEV